MSPTYRTYSAIDAVNFSSLKHMIKSPLHYDWARRNPSPDTTGRLKGRGTHTAVLEPDRFLLDYALFKGKVRRGKEWVAFKAVHDEESILRLDEYNHCLTVAKAVRAYPEAGALLNGAETEKTIEWTDKETGLPCKARLDIFNDGGVYDLKGVKSTDGRQLASEIAKMMYFVQLAFYMGGAEVALGVKDGPGGLICVEHAGPHDVVVVEPEENSLDMGRELVRKLLLRVAECRESGKWPGRYETRQLIALPAWAFDDDADFEDGLIAEEVTDGGL